MNSNRGQDGQGNGTQRRTEAKKRGAQRTPFANHYSFQVLFEQR